MAYFEKEKITEDILKEYLNAEIEEEERKVINLECNERAGYTECVAYTKPKGSDDEFNITRDFVGRYVDIDKFRVNDFPVIVVWYYCGLITVIRVVAFWEDIKFEE